MCSSDCRMSRRKRARAERVIPHAGQGMPVIARKGQPIPLKYKAAKTAAATEKIAICFKNIFISGCSNPQMGAGANYPVIEKPRYSTVNMR